ncbi:MAG: hypothetical protein IIA45_03810 [Bacteroidetes bacterium]|nr:hypothetical protein [Bacteroidota bacterium]
MRNKNTFTKEERKMRVAFIEYESPSKDGHFITVINLNRRVIGRIKKTYIKGEGKYVYTAYDRQGKTIFTPSTKLWEIKKKMIAYAKTKGLAKQDSKSNQNEKESPKSKQQNIDNKKGKEKPMTEEEKKFWRVQELRHQLKENEKEKEKSEISR